jgi:Flp pilus assembly protein TadD
LAVALASASSRAHPPAGTAATSEMELELRTAVEIAPADSAVRLRYALVLLARLKLVDAERELAQVLAATPREPAALSGLGELRTLQGRPAEGVELFRKALALSPGEAMIRFHLGQALELLGRAPEAADAYRQALAQLDRSAADSARSAGEIRAALDKLAGAPAPPEKKP